MKKTLITILIAMALAGCSAVSQVADFVNGNPFVADQVVRQAVSRYIAAGDEQEQYQRATDVKTVLERTLAYLEGNPEARVESIMAVIDAQINWDRLSQPDQLLVKDIMGVVQAQLLQKQALNELPNDVELAVRSLIKTALAAASLFV